jgi:hypothetical protein
MLAAMASDRFRAAASLSGSADQKANAFSQPNLVSFDQSDIREFELRSPVARATFIRCRTSVGPASIFEAYAPRAARLAQPPKTRSPIDDRAGKYSLAPRRSCSMLPPA